MNWADGTILAVLGLSVLIGLWRGLITEVLSLAIWVTAFLAARLFGPSVAGLFTHYISSPTARLIIAYIICFPAVLIIGAIVRAIVRRLVWNTGMTGTDRLLGMGFGFARGVVLVALGVFLVSLTGFTHQAWWQQSVLLPQFQGVATWLGGEIPSNAKQYMHPSVLLDQLPSLPTSRSEVSMPSSGGSGVSGNSAAWLSGQVPSNLQQYMHVSTMFDHLPSMQSLKSNGLTPQPSMHSSLSTTDPAPASTVF
jgi:membrane protein required for colicin V production